MERDFGSEMTRLFGTRLKRIYELDETALPAPIALWLERLRRAEKELAERAEQDAPQTPTGS